MTETSSSQRRQDGPHTCYYAHDDCERCPQPSVSTAHLSKITRQMMDAIGDVHMSLNRDPEFGNVWDVGVRVYSSDTPPGGTHDIEHVATVGIPSFMPPNCPEWLWLLYTALGEMCTHFMDLHDLEDTPSTAERP